MKIPNKLIKISIYSQEMACFEDDNLVASYLVSTAKNGVGEEANSECTPCGWHKIHSVIGIEQEINSVFISRKWTGEIFSAELTSQFPERDWILTRILWLEGLEPGRNKEGNVDSLNRHIYIHGTPDSMPMGIAKSHGCIRMRNIEIINLAYWALKDTLVYIE